MPEVVSYERLGAGVAARGDMVSSMGWSRTEPVPSFALRPKWNGVVARLFSGQDTKIQNVRRTEKACSDGQPTKRDRCAGPAAS